jgi:hypothetical protein
VQSRWLGQTTGDLAHNGGSVVLAAQDAARAAGQFVRSALEGATLASLSPLLESALIYMQHKIAIEELGDMLALLCGDQRAGQFTNPVPRDTVTTALLAGCALHPGALPGAYHGN